MIGLAPWLGVQQNIQGWGEKKGEQLLVRMALTYYGSMAMHKNPTSQREMADSVANHWRTIASLVKTEVRARVLSSAVHAVCHAGTS